MRRFKGKVHLFAFCFIFNAISIARSQKILMKNLTCYECGEDTFKHVAREHNPCIHFNQSLVPHQVCSEGEPYCWVKRSEMNGQTLHTVRGCSHSCEDECVIVGDVQILMDCFSCCQTSLCNVGNTAPAPLPSSTPLLLTLMLTTLHRLTAAR